MDIKPVTLRVDMTILPERIRVVLGRHTRKAAYEQL